MMTFVRERAEKFDLGRVVSRTFGAIQGEAAMFYAIALFCVGLPSALLQILQMGGAVHSPGVSPLSAVFSQMNLAAMVISFVARSLGEALLISGALVAFSGLTQTFTVQFRHGLAVIFPIIGIYVLNVIAIGAAMILLIVPGLIVLCMLCVAVPARVAERTSVIGALSRSAELTRGHRWSIFGLLVLYAVAAWIIYLVVGLLNGLLFFGGFGRSYLTGSASPLAYGGVVVSALEASVVTMVSAVGVAALYAELRLVKDGPQTQSLAEVFA